MRQLDIPDMIEQAKLANEAFYDGRTKLAELSMMKEQELGPSPEGNRKQRRAYKAIQRRAV